MASSGATWRAAAALLLVLTGSAAGFPAPAAAAHWRPFAPDSIFNLRLRADVPVHPQSAQYVGALATLAGRRGTYLNTSRCAMPLFWASRRTPRRPVTLDAPQFEDQRLLRAWRAVPIPRSARPADCSDANLAVALRRADGRVSVWEFWRVRSTRAGRHRAWRAKWGGYTDDVRTDRGVASKLSWRAAGRDGRTFHSDPQWNVTASSISMIAGVITRRDLAARRINHALAVATTDTARGQWFFPAQRTDGGSYEPFAIPAGAHLRLDPDVDIDDLGLTPMVRMMAKAAQRYGVVVRDRTYGTNVFYTDGTPAAARAATRLFAGRSNADAMRRFPWDDLELVDAPLCVKTYGRCEAAPRVVVDASTGRPSTSRALRLDTSNSVLNFPRRTVEWDLDGDGRYELGRGAKVALTIPAGRPKPRVVRVRIVTTDGAEALGRLSLGAP